MSLKLPSGNGFLLVTGVSPISNIFYADPVTEQMVKADKVYVTMGSAVGEEATTSVYIYDDINIYSLRSISFEENKKYKFRLRGVSNKTVYVSKSALEDINNIVDLENTVETTIQVQDDEIEEFCIGNGFNYIFWTEITIDEFLAGIDLDVVADSKLYFAYTTANVQSAKCSTCNGEGEIGGEVCSSCGGTGENYKGSRWFNIQGQCSHGTEKNIYISYLPDPSRTFIINEDGWISDEDYAFLIENRVPHPERFELSEGSTTFNFNAKILNDGYVVVWCETAGKGETLTVTSVTQRESAEDIPEDTNPCLTGDTLITMTDGSQKRLDELKIGDILLTEEGPSKIYSLQRGVHYPNRVLYYFEDGTIIKEVKAHSFYNVEDEYFKTLSQWKIGEHAINEDGEYIALIAKEQIDEETEQFGLWTEQGTYYAERLLTAGPAYNIDLMQDLSIEKIVDLMMSIDEDVLKQFLAFEEY